MTSNADDVKTSIRSISHVWVYQSGRWSIHHWWNCSTCKNKL